MKPLNALLSALYELEAKLHRLEELEAEVARLKKVEADFHEYVRQHVASVDQTARNWIEFFSKAGVNPYLAPALKDLPEAVSWTPTDTAARAKVDEVPHLEFNDPVWGRNLPSEPWQPAFFRERYNGLQADVASTRHPYTECYLVNYVIPRNSSTPPAL